MILKILHSKGTVIEPSELNLVSILSLVGHEYQWGFPLEIVLEPTKSRFTA